MSIKFSFAYSNIESITIPSKLTKIEENALCQCKNLLSVDFQSNSKIQTIEKNAFNDSNIESLTIPSSVANLEEGWNYNTEKLTKVNLSDDNPFYKVYDNKFLIGKRQASHESYDSLIFCFYDAKTVIIPNFIEQICVGAFKYCNKIEHFEFQKESKLQTIGDNAFWNCSIESIEIPKSVTHIGK